ncbi:hypothetical protein EHS25_005189 [Saitozyma podzolica]|uniref:FR47-like domain-containing protein n=1 Tax=Saitozyma podzolica TaxID=1890683 RepID=A0A427XZ03_9TREE|nr:hypothetical protein EHS25_005189 [Saitozyma podzolica]
MSQSILHKHDALSLVTLLEGHLPYSLPVYGTILANIPEPGISPDEYGNTHPLSAWATFPPGSPSLEPWVIIVPLGTPLEDQIRLYCSAETSCPDTSASDYPSGLDTVKRALRSYGELSPGFKMVGALNALWVPEVERFLHGQPRGRCNVFLPPLTGLGDSQAPEALEVEGYTVDHGREAEVEVFRDTSDIKRPSAYYRARLPWSTVIRPSSSAEVGASASSTPAPAAALVLTHMDGSLGALHTDAAYRRKGLARWVVQQHLKTGRGLLRNPRPNPISNPDPDPDPSPATGSANDLQDDTVARGGRGGEGGEGGGGGGAWTVVFRGNEASEGLWINLGWRVGWECAWVYKGD